MLKNIYLPTKVAISNKKSILASDFEEPSPTCRTIKHCHDENA